MQRRLLLGFLAATLGAVAVLALLAFYGQYWKWRHDFNDQGRVFDAATETVYLEQSGIAWGGCAFLFGAGALVAGWLAWRPRR